MSDDRTLDEIKQSDDDNFDHILDACDDKIFPSQVYAYEYRMHCVERALQYLE